MDVVQWKMAAFLIGMEECNSAERRRVALLLYLQCRATSRYIAQLLPGSWRVKKAQTTLFLKRYKNTLYCSKYSAPDDIMSLKHWGETLPLIFIHVPLCRSPHHLCICPHLKLLSALCEGVGWLLYVGALHLNDKTFVKSLWQNKADRSLYKDERKKDGWVFCCATSDISIYFIVLFLFSRHAAE